MALQCCLQAGEENGGQEKPSVVIRLPFAAFLTSYFEKIHLFQLEVSGKKGFVLHFPGHVVSDMECDWSEPSRVLKTAEKVFWRYQREQVTVAKIAFKVVNIGALY